MRTKWPTTGSILCVGSAAFPFAKEHARKILCENSERSGALFDSNTHPDFKLIEPDPNSQGIKIDQIRDLIDWATGKPQISGKQIAILFPAHLMNTAAANALLKTLEEPSLETLIILVSDKPSFIPATLRSRCYWIRLRSAVENLAPSALEIKIEQDLEALRLGQRDPISIGIEWIKEDPKTLLDLLLQVLHRKTIPFVETKNFARNRAWWQFIDQVHRAKVELTEQNAPNIQLLFESLLIEYNMSSTMLR